MFILFNVLFIKNAYAGTGSAQDSGLLFIVLLGFFALLLVFIYIYEQVKKIIDHLLNSEKSDFNDNLPVGE